MSLENLSDPTRIAVDEKVIAHALGMSIPWLRKDRMGKREIPFYRIGGRVKYDLATVRQVLQGRMEGGQMPKPRVNARKEGGAA